MAFNGLGFVIKRDKGLIEEYVVIEGYKADALVPFVKLHDLVDEHRIVGEAGPLTPIVRDFE